MKWAGTPAAEVRGVPHVDDPGLPEKAMRLVPIPLPRLVRHDLDMSTPILDRAAPRAIGSRRRGTAGMVLADDVAPDGPIFGDR